MKPILVTGATGKMGGTGRHLTHFLLKAGAPVRAMVRQMDDRSAELVKAGAEVVIGDFLDEDSLRGAMKGAGAAYFCAPVFDVLLHATTVFALCAKEAGVDRIINVSQMGTKDPILSPATRLHRLSEMIFDWSGVPSSHLRATVYLEQLTNIFGPAVRMRGALVAPLNDQKVCMIAGADVARVAAGIALHPDQFGAGPYHLTGPKNFNFAEVAETLSAALQKKIAYIDIPPAEWKQTAIERGMTPHLAAHLDKLYEKGRLGRLDHTPTDIVERVGGTPAVSLSQFINENVAAFSAPAAGTA
ncbi:MAG: hypothetical protein A4S14_05850 [Proteobacteria bacterium SG_bin9]|nr:MAG: hypothetical protein A4S14_05850 [Proteobacteria bacterium SG_bin9]